MKLIKCLALVAILVTRVLIGRTAALVVALVVLIVRLVVSHGKTWKVGRANGRRVLILNTGK